ncbi:MAG TPA: universal stress protein [Noviherbaspirillum sp.]
MFKTILVPTDGSALSDKAVDAALQLARENGSTVVGLSVAEPFQFSPLSEQAMSDECAVYEEKMRAQAMQHVEKVAAAARAMDIPCETVVAQSFMPYEKIIETAQDKHCDAIVMASHGRTGFDALVHGSQTQKVLTHSKIPVLVYR